MEYFPCYSFDECLPHGNHLTEDEIREITSCCLLGLNDIHSRNLIHGVDSGVVLERIERATGEHVVH